MKAEPTRDADSDDLNRNDQMVAALWTEVLQLPNPPHLTDNFFSLGGDSMAAVTLEFRIHEELSIHLTPGTLFGAPTLGELLRVVDRLMADAEAAQDSSPSGPNDRAGRSMAQS